MSAIYLHSIPDLELMNSRQNAALLFLGWHEAGWPQKAVLIWLLQSNGTQQCLSTFSFFFFFIINHTLSRSSGASCMDHWGAGWSGARLILFQRIRLCPNGKSAPLHGGQLMRAVHEEPLYCKPQHSMLGDYRLLVVCRRAVLELLVVGMASRICAECKPPKIICSLLDLSGNLIMRVSIFLNSFVFLSLRVGLFFRMKKHTSKCSQIPS